MLIKLVMKETEESQKPAFCNQSLITCLAAFQSKELIQEE